MEVILQGDKSSFTGICLYNICIYILFATLPYHFQNNTQTHKQTDTLWNCSLPNIIAKKFSFLLFLSPPGNCQHLPRCVQKDSSKENYHNAVKDCFHNDT